MFFNDIKRKPNVRVVIFDSKGVPVQEFRFHNLITTAGLAMLRDALQGYKCGIQYIALGNGAASPAAGDTKLDHEIYRKQRTEYAVLVDGSLQTTCYIAVDEANANLTEIGWFGPDGSDWNDGQGKDTGTLYAHALFPGGAYLKDQNHSVMIQRVDKLTASTQA